MISVVQSACLHDIKGIRAVKLSIEFVVVPSPVDTIFDFRAAYRLENLSLKYEQLVLLPFSQHPRLTAVEQDWADQGLVNGEFVRRERWLDCRCFHSPKKHLFAVWILRCFSKLKSFFGVTWYTNSLKTSKCLSPIATLCPRHESSYHSGPQSYILSFDHLFLTLLWLLLFPMLNKHPERLTDSYQRYLYHRHTRVFVLI
jgi:hypothetical protein